MPWFHRPELVSRWLADFITSQMRQLRPQYAPPGAFTNQMRLDRSTADIDSIELIEVASALYLALDAESSGALNDYAEQHGNLGQDFGAWCKFVRFAAEKSPTLWFQSSGSTGQRRWISHQLAHLEAEVREVAAIVLEGGHRTRRVVSVMPAHHVYGFLFGTLLPAMLDVPMLHARGGAPAMLRAQLKPGDVLVAHPNFWSGALLTSHANSQNALFPADVLGFSAGQALPDALFIAAKRAGLARLIELYGATETAGIGWRDSDIRFTLLSRYRWANASGNTLIDGFAKQSLTVHPPDLIERANDQFLVLGRVDRVLQIAGQNVHLDAVEARLAEFPGVEMARVRCMPADDPHARLHAFIVCQQSINSSDLRSFASAHLQTAEIPQSYTFGAELPKTEAGKECDWVVDRASRFPRATP